MLRKRLRKAILRPKVAVTSGLQNQWLCALPQTYSQQWP